MKLFAVTIAVKNADNGKPEVISLLTYADAETKADVWKALIGDEDSGLNNNIEALAGIKDTLATAKASDLGEEALTTFIRDVEANADLDIFVWDLLSGDEQQARNEDKTNDCNGGGDCSR